MKRTNWNLPNIIQETPITGDPTFYIYANKSRKSGYIPENSSKMDLSL